jgi:DivIVA domain-containing protein
MPSEPTQTTEHHERPSAPEEQPLTVGNLRSHVPAELRNVSFPVAVRGYDRRAVDDYLGRMNRVIAELEVSRSPQAAVRYAVDRVTEQTKAILQQARESGEQITTTAREEAEQIVGSAKAEAAELVVNASNDADRAKLEADQLLADARAEATKIVEEADADAARRRKELERELADLEAKAEERMRSLQADTNAVWDERRGLLDDIHGLASRLQEAASQAAARVTSDEETPDTAAEAAGKQKA